MYNLDGFDVYIYICWFICTSLEDGCRILTPHRSRGSQLLEVSRGCQNHSEGVPSDLQTTCCSLPTQNKNLLNWQRRIWQLLKFDKDIYLQGTGALFPYKLPHVLTLMILFPSKIPFNSGPSWMMSVEPNSQQHYIRFQLSQVLRLLSAWRYCGLSDELRCKAADSTDPEKLRSCSPIDSKKEVANPGESRWGPRTARLLPIGGESLLFWFGDWDHWMFS